MHSLTVLGPAVQLAAFASFSHSVSATNLVKFINHCQYDLFYWPVGSPAAHGPPPEDADYIRVPAQSQGTHQMLDTSTGGGISLKIRDLPYYSAAHGILQAEYNVVPDGRVYYDLSLVNCNKLDDPTDHTFCPFASGGVWMYSDVAESQEHGLDCLPAHCTLFTDRCMATYWSHGAWSGEPTLQCPAGRDYYVETCTDNPGKRSDDGQPFESTSAPWVKPPWNPLWGPEGFFTYRPDYIYSPPGWPARENVPPPGVPAGPISAPAPGSAPAPSPAPAPPAPKPDDSWPLPPCDKPGRPEGPCIEPAPPLPGRPPYPGKPPLHPHPGAPAYRPHESEWNAGYIPFDKDFPCPLKDVPSCNSWCSSKSTACRKRGRDWNPECPCHGISRYIL